MGITVLTRMAFSPSEIMSVHKSMQSFTNYQQTQPKQKVTMGKQLYKSITRLEENITACKQPQLLSNEQHAIQYPSAQPLIASPRTPFESNIDPATAVIPFEANFHDDDIADFDLITILNDMENEQRKTKGLVAVTMTSTSNVLNNIPKSMFSNCTIQNVTFNFAKLT